MYKVLKQEGRAKRAEVTTVHGTIQTPVFMNVGTVAAIKGAVSTADLEEIGTQRFEFGVSTGRNFACFKDKFSFGSTTFFGYRYFFAGEFE